ncbi:hypothetical protein BDQ12DRAFT_668977 [Crucibulum laeve]|uniref:Uncharacterized protein n=1 Tax=Crucibulum laeve TaxID=68775 RepID=A0A5C3LP96_9AGAR|nr:hypothetical protein BDQ12DRAFT_668977 [Crucibulum laeve]
MNCASLVVWSARTYAVFGKNRIVLAYFSILGLACIILDVIQVPATQCHGSSLSPLVGGLLSIFMVIFEFTSALLTVIRSVQALNVGGSWKFQRGGFTYLVLEQGILYFCGVFMFTLASLILNIKIPGGFLQRLLNAFTIPLSGLFTARFLLNLRKWEVRHSANASKSSQHDSTTMQFSHVGTSLQDDFGEDPVARATRDRSRGEIIMEISRVQPTTVVNVV